MTDWQIITDAEPWQVQSPDMALVRETTRRFQPSRRFESTYPRLTDLRHRARQSEVVTPSGTYVLFAWGEADTGIRAWLSPVAPLIVPEGAAPDHRIMLEGFGGIKSRFNEPEDNWLLNHYQSLTADEVHRDASFLAHYSWAFEEFGGIPIDVAKYYPASWEANGNCVLRGREDGQIIYFAPDHADDNLVPYDRCPMYTLHTHRGASSLREWVEQIAARWALAT